MRQAYRCGDELWARAAPAQCRAPMVRLAGLGQTQPSPAQQISAGLLTLIAIGAAVGAAEGAAIGAVAGDRGRRGRAALKGAAAGAVLNTVGLVLITLPTLRALNP